MASLTLKNVPDELLERLRRRAREERRSLSQEALYLLERALDSSARRARESRATQVTAWRELAGGWVSERSVEEEIGEIYSARTSGRPVDW